MRNFDLSLYLITDENLIDDNSFEFVIEEALKGGATILQLREKKSSTRDFLKKAFLLKSLSSKYNVPLLINDRIDIAIACDADGVHIGQSDMPYEYARKLLGKDKIIGLSIESFEEAEEAEKFDLDYIAISPVFSTPTKQNTKIEFGIEGTKKICSLTRHKTVAIGGININNVSEVISTGVDGISVISAILCAENHYQAAVDFKSKILTHSRGSKP
jgi:thiamine-phosphate pyrophosphorylase